MINPSAFRSQFSQTVIINGMLSIFFNIFGVLVFLFVFWKRLKEDYASKMIFTSSFYMLVGLFAGKLVSFYFFPLWWFWSGFLGVSLGFVLGVLRFKLRAFEAIDAAVPGLLLWFSFLFLGNAISFSSLSSLIASAFLVVLTVLYFVLDGHYKSFAWYKSGRIGFSGLTVLGVFFLARAVVAATFHNVLSFVGTLDIIISAVAAFASFLTVFNLARKRT